MRRMFIIPVLIAGMLLAGAPTPAHAATITLNFTNDTAGNKPNGFTSVDSAAVAFSDSSGTGLNVSNFGSQSNGNALAVFDDDASFLIMNFSSPQASVTLNFGNDDPNYSQAGDQAVLRLFNGATQVAVTSVTMNRNDLMDQSISASSGSANVTSATVFYDVTGGGLIEIVDDIVISGPDGFAACDPSAAVPAGYNLITGTASNDTIDGTSGKDLIRGLAGNDTIRAYSANDIVCGNEGNDTLYGGSGDDVLDGGPGTDTLNGGSGFDRGLDPNPGTTTRISIEKTT